MVDRHDCPRSTDVVSQLGDSPKGRQDSNSIRVDFFPGDTLGNSVIRHPPMHGCEKTLKEGMLCALPSGGGACQAFTGEPQFHDVNRS